MTAQPVSTAYLSFLVRGEVDGLLGSFEGQPHVDDPLAGHVHGEEEMRRFAEERAAWLREREAEVGLVSETLAHNRTVSELLLRLTVERGRVALPVAVVGERAGGRPLCVADPGFGAAVVERTSASSSVMHIRVYHSTWLLTGGHELRPALLHSEHVTAPDVVGRYQKALALGDTGARPASAAGSRGVRARPDWPPRGGPRLRRRGRTPRHELNASGARSACRLRLSDLEIRALEHQQRREE